MMDTSRPSTPLSVITVNGKSFVSGLTWKTLESYRSYMTEAREFGKANNMDMVAIRRGQVLQAGFAPKSDLRLRGMYSLAAALAGQLGENWIGVFPLPNERYAFVAVYEGSVMVGRDLVGDRDTIEVEFNEAYNLLQSEPAWSGKGAVIAPADWEVGDDNRTLEDLLDPKALRNDYRLRPLTFGLTRRELVLLCVALLAVAGAGFGFLKWQAYQEHKKTAEHAAKVAELQRLQAEHEAAMAAELRKNLKRPWKDAPSVAGLLEACASLWQNAPLSVGGWLFVEGSCTPVGGRITYKRPPNGTTVADFANTVRTTFNTHPGIYDAGTTGAIQLGLSLTPAQDDVLQPSAVLLEGFTAHMQAAGEPTSFTLEEVPWKAPEDQPDAIQPDWTTYRYSITTPNSPAELMAGLDTQGIRIAEISVALAEQTSELQWKLSGEIYGR